MRIVIDDGFSMSRPTGIGRYTTWMIKALTEYAPEVEVLLSNLHYLQTIRPRIFRRGAYFLWSATGYPLQLQNYKPDIVHFTNYLPAFWKPKGMRFVVTIYDLAPIRFPGSKSWAYTHYFRQAVERGIRMADVVLTDSYAVRAEISQMYDIEPDRIHVCYIGTDISYLPGAHARPLIQKLLPGKSDKQFLLFVGTLERRKNLVPLVQALRLVRMRFPDLNLVLAGKPGIGFEQIEEAISYVDPQRKFIHLLANCNDQDLRALYSTCTAFVFPSIYEGYGIPLLEAMACNAPIIASDIPTNREIGGDAILIVKTFPDDIAAGVLQILESAKLRKGLIMRGQRHVASFTLQQTAQQLLSVYKATLQG